MYGDHRRIPKAKATPPGKNHLLSFSFSCADRAFATTGSVPIQRNFISLASSLRACVLFCVLSVKLSCAQSLYQSTPGFSSLHFGSFQ